MCFKKKFAETKETELLKFVNSQLSDKEEHICFNFGGYKNDFKFCRLFGMTKLKGSDHDSSLYEITMIPPKFRILSKKSKQLYDYYQKKYNDAPYLFMED